MNTMFLIQDLYLTNTLYNKHNLYIFEWIVNYNSLTYSCLSSLFLSTFGRCVSRIPWNCRNFSLCKIMESPWQEGITRLQVNKKLFIIFQKIAEFGESQQCFITIHCQKLCRTISKNWKIYFWRGAVPKTIKQNRQ